MLLGWGKHTIQVFSSHRNGSYLLLLTNVLEALLCLFFLLRFVWIKSGHNLHTVLTARLVTCGCLEENCLCAWRGCPTGGHLFESSLRDQNRKKCCSISFLMTKTMGTGAFGAKFGKAGNSLMREMLCPSPWEKQAQRMSTLVPTG